MCIIACDGYLTEMVREKPINCKVFFVRKTGRRVSKLSTDAELIGLTKLVSRTTRVIRANQTPIVTQPFYLSAPDAEPVNMERHMSDIVPRSQAETIEVLSGLAHTVADGLGIAIEPYDTILVLDTSGDVHWMYHFDDREKRIYRTQKGSQRFVEISINDDGSINLNGVILQIENAIEELKHKDY